MATAVDSACTNRLPSLKFVVDTLSVSALIGLVTLTRPFVLAPCAHYYTLGGQLPTNFGISGTFCYWLIQMLANNLLANTCQTDHVILRPWPLTLEVMALVGDMSSYSICVPVWTSYSPFSSKDMTHLVSTLVDLMTLTFNLWPWSCCAWLLVWWTTFLPMSETVV